MPSPTDVRHFDLKMSQELYEKIRRMSQQSGSSEPDVLKKAIALYDVAFQAAAEGKRIFIAGTQERSIVVDEYPGEIRGIFPKGGLPALKIYGEQQAPVASTAGA